MWTRRLLQRELKYILTKVLASWKLFVCNYIFKCNLSIQIVFQVTVVYFTSLLSTGRLCQSDRLVLLASTIPRCHPLPPHTHPMQHQDIKLHRTTAHFFFCLPSQRQRPCCPAQWNHSTDNQWLTPLCPTLHLTLTV